MTWSSTSMPRTLRFLLILVCASAAAVVAVAVANTRALGGGFYDGLDALVDRAKHVREAARAEYQSEVLTTLPANPGVGPFFRFDDRMAEARVVEEPVRTEAYEGFENVFAYEFDDPQELEPAEGPMSTEARDGVLRVHQTKDGYLRNAKPISIVTDDVGEVVIRARARKGKHLALGWNPAATPDRPWVYRIEIPLIADGEFHTYFINARNALRRGLDEGSELRFLAVRPSDVEGDEVELDFIHFLSTRSKYMRKARDVLYETVANEMRAVMYMLPRQALEYSVRVPDNAPHLSFGTAVIGRGSRVRFTVRVIDGATATDVHDETVDAPGAWRDASYDLARWAGRDVVVRLGVDGDIGSVGLWSSPLIHSRPSKPFRAVIILEDAQRPDHLSVYGYDKQTSPFKEQLLRDQGALFLRARSQETKTRPSVPSMMTSLLPSATGVWNFADMLRPEFLTLAEVLRQQGFATASFTQNSNAGPAAGLQQGFDVADDQAARGQPQDLLEGEALWSWMQRRRDQNFFVYLHIVDPHGPYDPPPPYDAPYRALAPGDGPPQARRQSIDATWVKTPTREGRIALYDGEIRHTDAVLGRFFDRLKAEGLYEDTLFVFVADHGEHLGERGLWEHKPPGHVQVTGVPLIMIQPRRISEPRRFDEPTQLLDVMPTVLEFAGVDASELAMQGDSLVSLIEGRDREFWRNRVTASEEVTVRDRARAWRNRGPWVSGSLFYRDWHFIASRAFWPRRGFWPESLRLKVFNVAEDPREFHSLTRFLPDVYLRLRYTLALNRLQSISEEARRRFTPTQEQNYEFDPDTLEHLKALGYVQ
jgi:arylsulfatase A-like enzyme